jgi:2-succinyl-6-hydroxy-2,4-cyclohexadiene-1-carboxylate synthase
VSVAVMMRGMSPAIVLLHGFTHTGASWGAVTAALPERYLALAPDIRGHGSASQARPVSLAAVLDDLAELAPGPFTLVGYSMGGRIALHAALELASRVKELVLIGASPGIADPAERLERRRADESLAAHIEGASIEEFAARWARIPTLRDQPRRVAAAVHADRLRNTPAGLASALRGLGTGSLPSLWSSLDALAMPVTLVVGGRDRKFRQIAQEMAAGIAHSDIVVIPGSGHAAHLEAPSLVAALIASRAT